MLPREKRLNLKKDFKWVAAGGKVENNLVKLFFKAGSNQLPKVGIATSKAVFRKAVDRNRARRLVSFGFEALYNRLPQGINIVALPKKEIIQLNSEEVKDSLEGLLEKVGVLEDEKNSH